MAATELLVRVNGIQPAFGIEFGLVSPQADEGCAASQAKIVVDGAGYSDLRRGRSELPRGRPR